MERIQGFRFRVSDFGFRVEVCGLWLRVERCELRCRVSGLVFSGQTVSRVYDGKDLRWHGCNGGKGVARGGRGRTFSSLPSSTHLCCV